jgi:hypothetical protein
MSPVLDDATSVQDDDQVGRQHGRQAVRDHERRAPSEQAAESGLDEALGRPRRTP